ncbi:MAG: hypothetical protein RL088_1674 [Verrucomicrobiota bacterium]|jgi:YD repeat-containing protein
MKSTIALVVLALPALGSVPGTVISYRYDAAGRLTNVNYGGTSSTTYAYDKNGSLLSRTNAVAPLPPFAANYAGSISNLDPSVTNTGAVALKLLPTGAFSGKLVLGGKTFPFKGTFADDGTSAPIVITRKLPLANLTLSLALDVAGGTNQITGTITDGTFTSDITLDRAAYDKKSNPVPGGIAGNYTVQLRPTQALGPQGFGYGTAKVDTGGGVKFAGVLGDNTKISQSATISSAGTWAFHLPLYKSGGILSGLVTFASDPGGSDFAGVLDWQKPATTGPLYPDAFATEVNLIGSRYVIPPKGQPVLDFAAGLGNARLLTLGSAPLDKLITLDVANKFIVPADAAKLKLTLTVPTGIFLGSYVNGGSTFKIGGVLFHEQNLGGGMVIGPAATAPATITQP